MASQVTLPTSKSQANVYLMVIFKPSDGAKCQSLNLRFVQILRFVCVGNETNLSLLLVSVDLFRIRHVKVCTGRLGQMLPAAQDLQQPVHDSMGFLLKMTGITDTNVKTTFVSFCLFVYCLQVIKHRFRLVQCQQ